MIERSHIISLNVHNLSFADSLTQVSNRGLQHQRGFVCFANVHMTIEAYNDSNFQLLLDKALLILPDGKPIALACKWLYKKKQERISGMDFMPAILEQAHKQSSRLFLYGSTPKVLDNIKDKIRSNYPGAIIAGAISPPFRQLNESEIKEHITQINESGAHYVLVALGCPKQEKWMAANYDSINAVLLGLGGAFPVTAGLQKRSPAWMQKLSLEWLYRLAQEPRRLFKRYLYTNTLFLWLLAKEFLKKKA